MAGLESLALWLLELVNLGITILVIMAIWEIWQFFSFGGTSSGIGGAGSKAWDKLKPYVRGTGAHARRVQKRELNEYILEEREQKLLDSLKGQALNILTDLEAVASSKSIEFSDKERMVTHIEDLGRELTETKKTFRDLSKRTSRATNGMDKMLNYFKKNSIKVPDNVKELEEKVMMLNLETGKEIATVQEVYDKIVDSQAMKAFKDIPDNGSYVIETTSTPFNLKHLYDLIAGFRKQEFLLEDAYKKQSQAKQWFQGIIQETRSLYE